MKAHFSTSLCHLLPGCLPVKTISTKSLSSYIAKETNECINMLLGYLVCRSLTLYYYRVYFLSTEIGALCRHVSYKDMLANLNKHFSNFFNS